MENSKYSEYIGEMSDEWEAKLRQTIESHNGVTKETAINSLVELVKKEMFYAVARYVNSKK